MKVRFSSWFLVLMSALVAGPTACDGDDGSTDSGTDLDGDGDAGGDADGDADGDVDGDADGDVDGDAGDDALDADDSGDDDADDDGALTDADAPSDVDVAPDADTDLSGFVGMLSVDCDVPFILDESRTKDTFYMGLNFAHLVQQYCITGVLDDVDITAYPEKMYYGSHHATEPTLFLNQVSMNNILTMIPQYSVKVQLVPDSSVITGSTWFFGGDERQLTAAVFHHPSMQETCLFAWGLDGSLFFDEAADTTAVEGGSFSVVGSMLMVDPHMVTGLCETWEGSVPCCD